MDISKTKFIDFAKRENFSLIEKVRYYEENKNVILHDDIYKLENNKYTEIIKSEITNIDDLDVNVDIHLETMMPYYNKLELITGSIIKNKFGGNVIYSSNTYLQKKFSFKKDNTNFYCFLDGYQEDSNNINIFETKATTSSKYSNKYFNVTFKEEERKYKREFFSEVDGIYYPLEDLDVDLSNSNYYLKEKDLFNILGDKGKYIYDLAFQRYVFEKSIKTNKEVKYYLVILNHEYIYDGKKDSNNDFLYSNDLVRFYDLTSITKKMLKEIDLLVDKLITKGISYKLSEEEVVLYEKLLEDNSILTYLSNHKGFKDLDGNLHSTIDLIKNFNYTKITDVSEYYLNRKNNIIQREVILNNKPYYNKDKIKALINKLNYPIYHLDFESFNSPLPRFKGESPYMQSLFQFSIHIEHSPGVCNKESDHYSYLMKDHNDNREELIKELLNVIKDDNGSILVYNISFEKTRIKELAILFPKYKKELEKLIDRLFDLQHIVKNNKKIYEKLGFNKEDSSTINFYHPKLNGSYSIKKVLPIFSNLDYNNLEVKNGIEAMDTFVLLPSLDEKEFIKEYNDLVEYCKQDTFAMFEILSKLREI